MGARGNLLVGQSGGPTAVINNSLVGVIHEALQHEQIEGIYGMLHGIVGVFNEDFVDLRRESPETLEDLRDTPASALGTIRYKITDEDYARIVDVLRAYNVRYFFYIGGNDSMDTSHKIDRAAQEENYELYVIGVPKTIDNDLALTDHCPGYGSAARFAASAVRNSSLDTLAMGNSSPIKLIEVMGRDAGWLAGATALAKEHPEDPPHLIYVPEYGVSLQQISADIKACYEKHGYCVAAISEGLTDENGMRIRSSHGPIEVDPFGHEEQGGVVLTIVDEITYRLGIRPRYDKPGYLQRSFAELMSPVDREEAYMVGRAAVRAAVNGESAKMVTLVRQPGPEYVSETGLAPLDKVANAVHLLPKEFVNEAHNGVTDAFLDYARPLIGGPLPPYARLTKYPVRKRRH